MVAALGASARILGDVFLLASCERGRILGDHRRRRARREETHTPAGVAFAVARSSHASRHAGDPLSEVPHRAGAVTTAWPLGPESDVRRLPLPRSFAAVAETGRGGLTSHAGLQPLVRIPSCEQRPAPAVSPARFCPTSEQDGHRSRRHGRSAMIPHQIFIFRGAHVEERG